MHSCQVNDEVEIARAILTLASCTVSMRGSCERDGMVQVVNADMGSMQNLGRVSAPQPNHRTSARRAALHARIPLSFRYHVATLRNRGYCYSSRQGVMRASWALMSLAVLAYIMAAEPRAFTEGGRTLQQMAPPPMPAGTGLLQPLYQPKYSDLADDTYLACPVSISEQRTTVAVICRSNGDRIGSQDSCAIPDQSVGRWHDLPKR